MLSLFKSKKFDADQFEKELKQLSTRILKNEKKQHKLQNKKGHYKTTSIVYLSGLYISYIGYVYFMKNLRLKQLDYALIILSPILIFATYKLLDYFFNYLISNNTEALETLRNKHQEKLNELKEQTNFHKTNELLIRFSNGEDLQELESQAQEINAKKQEYMKLINEGKVPKPSPGSGPGSGSGSDSKFYDHLFNFMLGTDELSPDLRFALICKNCLQHNGLAPTGIKGEYVKYICPKCGVMNGIDKPLDEKRVEAETVMNEEVKVDEPTVAATVSDGDETKNTE